MESPALRFVREMLFCSVVQRKSFPGSSNCRMESRTRPASVGSDKLIRGVTLFSQQSAPHPGLDWNQMKILPNFLNLLVPPFPGPTTEAGDPPATCCSSLNVWFTLYKKQLLDGGQYRNLTFPINVWTVFHPTTC